MQSIWRLALLTCLFGGCMVRSTPLAAVQRLRGGSYNQGVDLREVVIKGSSAKPGAATKKGPSGPTDQAAARQRKLDADEGPGQSMPHELKVAIMKARQAKNMTQKQLAVQLNVLAQEIQWYETGKIVPDNALIARMDRVLGEMFPCACIPRRVCWAFSPVTVLSHGRDNRAK